jgi:hypothetical protein
MTQKEIEKIMQAIEDRMQREEKSALKEGREFNIFNTVGDVPEEAKYELQDLRRNLAITCEIAKNYESAMHKFSYGMLQDGFVSTSIAIDRCKDMMTHVIQMIEKEL